MASLALNVVGLVLAVFPIAIQTVEWYGARISGRDMKVLADSLKDNQQIFLNTVEYLLRTTVSSPELNSMLANGTAEAWRDADLASKVGEYLGAEADRIMENISGIYSTMLKLSQKLPDREVVDSSKLQRVKHVVKCFVRGTHLKASLERLRMQVNDLRELVNSALKLVPLRRDAAEDIKYLERFHEYASGLHDALKACWTCDCDQVHPANLQLAVWSQQGDGNSGSDRWTFSFLFAEDAQHAKHHHWMDAEVASPSLISGTSLNMEMLNKALTAAASVSAPPRRSAALSARAEPGRDNGTSTVAALQSEVNDEDVDLIYNICDVLKSPPDQPKETLHKVRQRVGSISDQNGHRFQLFSNLEPLGNRKTSVKLTEVYRDREVLSTASRVRLGLMLAWGVLQMSMTEWLTGEWTKDNILLVMDPPNKPLPYISHPFLSARRNSSASTLDPMIADRAADWMIDLSFYALGVILLELCYTKPIQELATKKEKDTQGLWVTALRLSRLVGSEWGVSYAKAVHTCLRQPSEFGDIRRDPHALEQYGRTVLKDIIEPLKTVVEFLERGPPS